MKILSDDEASFAITADSGVLAEQTLILLRTLRNHYPDASVLTFITCSEDEMDSRIYNEFREKSTVEHGDLPMEAYPLTAFQEAFRRASEKFDEKYTVAIDSDCAVFNRLSIPEETADLYAVRQYMGIWPWQASDGIHDDWITLFEKLEIEPPSEGSNGLTDYYPMWPPYYNGGVLVTTNSEIPEKLLEYTELIYDSELTENKPLNETEQIALALIAQEYKTVELDKTQNYMMGAHTKIPNDVSIVHYLSFETFSTISNKNLLQQLDDVGVQLIPKNVDRVSRTLGTVVFQGGKHLPKKWVKWYSGNVIPKLLTGEQSERVKIEF